MFTLKIFSRGFRGALIVLLLALLLCPSAAVRAATETLGVKAYGSAVNKGNSAAARQAALGEAIRDAVTSAVKEYLDLHGIEADEGAMVTGIYSRSESFILNYKILSERWITEMADEPVDGAGEAVPGEVSPLPPVAEGPPTYHVLINATLDMGALKRAILRIMGAEKTTDFKVVLLDISDYETFTAIMSTLKGVAVIEDLSYRSFSRDRFVLKARSVMDPVSLAREIGREAGRDFVVAAYGMDTVIIKAFPATGSP